MLCPRCSSIFDKKVAEHIQGMRAVKVKWGTNAQPKIGPEFRFDPRRGHQKGPMNQVRRTPTNVPIDTWINTMGRKRPNEERWPAFDVPRGSSLDYRTEYHASTLNKMAHISSNYKGKTLCPVRNGEDSKDSEKPKKRQLGLTQRLAPMCKEKKGSL